MISLSEFHALISGTCACKRLIVEQDLVSPWRGDVNWLIDLIGWLGCPDKPGISIRALQSERERL